MKIVAALAMMALASADTHCFTLKGQETWVATQAPIFYRDDDPEEFAQECKVSCETAAWDAWDKDMCCHSKYYAAYNNGEENIQ